MSLIKWKKRNAMFPNVNSIFDNFFADDDALFRKWKNGSAFPSVNVKNEEDCFCLEVAAPGLKKDDFKVEVDKGVLTISSETEKEEKEETEDFTRQEFSYSSFSRSFSLPEDVKDDDIDATYEDGILKLVIPKEKITTKKEVKKITIK